MLTESQKRAAKVIDRWAKTGVWRMETTGDGDKTSARMVRDSKRRLAKTNLGKLQALQSERERWERKQTIATNKLRAVRRQIEALAETMARATMETEWEGKQ